MAAGYLEAIYAADTAGLLAAVSAPAQVLHYRGDRVIPHRGGLQLAEGLPDARLVTLEGRYHLPDIRDLDQIVTPSSRSCPHAQVATVLPIAQPVAPDSQPGHRSLAVACRWL